MSFVKRVLSARRSVKLFYGAAALHLGVLGWLTYQRQVLGQPMALTWTAEHGLRQVTRVEWLEQQTRAAYRRVHYAPGNEEYQAILDEKRAALLVECRHVGMDCDAILAELASMYDSADTAAQADKPCLSG